MTSLVLPTVTIDGVKYAVGQNSYVRRWTRSFSSNLVANLVRLNFVDKGPGIRVYTFQIIGRTWETSTLPYQKGVTENYDAQRSSLEASYSKIATPLSFLDPLGEPPTFSGYTTTAVSSGDTTIVINNGLANLLSSPPTGSGGYPYTVYLWAQGTSLGAGLAGTSPLETAQISGKSGNTLSLTRSSPQDWLSGVNVAVPLGVYFTNLQQTITQDSTSASPRVTYDAEFTEATQVIA
jgi:hypothetical protein